MLPLRILGLQTAKGNAIKLFLVLLLIVLFPLLAKADGLSLAISKPNGAVTLLGTFTILSYVNGPLGSVVSSFTVQLPAGVPFSEPNPNASGR